MHLRHLNLHRGEPADRGAVLRSRVGDGDLNGLSSAQQRDLLAYLSLLQSARELDVKSLAHSLDVLIELPVLDVSSTDFALGTHSLLAVDCNILDVEVASVEDDLVDVLDGLELERGRATNGLLVPVDGPVKVDVVGPDVLVVGQCGEIPVLGNGGSRGGHGSQSVLGSLAVVLS